MSNEHLEYLREVAGRRPALVDADAQAAVRWAVDEVDRLRAILSGLAGLVPDYTWPEEYVRAVRAAAKSAAGKDKD